MDSLDRNTSSYEESQKHLEPAIDLYGIERQKVLQLTEDGKIEGSLAEELIRVSVYWYEHPSGEPVNAPNHVKRIYGLDRGIKKNDWKIDFGANTFCISKAVYRCQSILIKFLDEAEQGNSISLENLKKSLRLGVRQSVENNEGHEYQFYRLNYEKHMIFGATSISVDAFIDCIFRKCQTFKKTTRQHFEIRPSCKKKFSNRRELEYHRQVFHYRK